MKKFLPFILILIIVVNLFTPFNNVKAAEETGIMRGDYDFNLSLKLWATDTTARLEGILSDESKTYELKVIGVKYLFMEVTLLDSKGNPVGDPKEKSISSLFSSSTTLDFKDLTPNTDYQPFIKIIEKNNIAGIGEGEVISTYLAKTKIHTNDTNVKTSILQGTESVAMTDTDMMPACSLNPFWGKGTVTGCIAQAIYGVLFMPTSFVFALTGTFFDNTFAYSVSDASYRSTFVVEGWKIVRDLCNMFFIFILLYIAFSTILGLTGMDTKTMIMNVVVIGVMINFSLFAVQVIIDASNVLARVFYNSDTIKITQEKAGENGVTNMTSNAANGVTNATADVEENGTLPLSAALVNKVNPQNLIINAGKVGDIPNKGGVESGDAEAKGGVTTWTFILVTLLATGINIIGIVVFLSVGLIFVARVIGLWMAMILVPAVFFTYMIPQLKGIGTIGWTKWWPETLSLAFLAPVFIFFLYIILQFTEKGLGIINNDGATGIPLVISIIIPFAFIMVLLMKAKDIAKTMSGAMGQQITGALSQVGGLALGAATGGAAMLSRNTIGRMANKLNNSETLNDAASGKNGKIAQTFARFGKNVTGFTAKSSFDARKTSAGEAFGKNTGMDLNKNTSFVGLDTKKGEGGYVGSQDRKVEKENKFIETLGHDKGTEEKIQDEIGKRKGEIEKAENERDMANADAKLIESNSKFANPQKDPLVKEAKAKYAEKMKQVAALKNGGEYNIDDPNDPTKKIPVKIEKGLSGMEKDLERNKDGRKNEYALTRKRKSGKIYDIDITEKHVEKYLEEAITEKDPDKKKEAERRYTSAKEALKNPDKYRDKYKNIRKFGKEERDLKRGIAAAVSEITKGAIAGAIAGSIIPIVGTITGSISGAIIQGLKHSGTTNLKVGGKGREEKK